MSSHWFPEPFEISVDNPGYGELDFGFYLEGEGWKWTTLTGGELGEVLDAVTARALGGEWATRKLRPLSIEDARKVLRAFQHAVVLATSGTDRFERVFVDDDEQPQEPLCISCNEGSPYHQAVTISESCTERGHRPFGFGASTTWERAVERNARARNWWQKMRRITHPEEQRH